MLRNGSGVEPAEMEPTEGLKFKWTKNTKSHDVLGQPVVERKMKCSNGMSATLVREVPVFRYRLMDAGGNVLRYGFIYCNLRDSKREIQRMTAEIDRQTSAR